MSFGPAVPRSDPELSARPWFAPFVAGMALLLGLGITGAWLHGWQRASEAEDLLRFTQHVDRLEGDLQTRFHLPLYGLAGLRASMAAAGGALSRSSFRNYVEARDIEREFPGVRGFAFVQRLARQDAPAFEAAERASGVPWFNVRTAGSASDLFVIRFIEPLSRNAEALGFDLGSEPLRRQAIEQAIDTAAPTLTAPIVLLQDQRRGPGFLYLVPLYRFGADPLTPAHRRAVLQGLIYVPLVVSELLDGAADQQAGRVDFKLVALPAQAGPAVVFDSERPLLGTAGAALPPGPVYAGRHFVAMRSLVIGQQRFELHVATAAAFERASGSLAAWSLGLGGVALSLLLSSTLWLLARGRARAVALAASMTADLDRLAKVAQRTSNAVVITDAERRITWVNEGFTRLSGYTLDEVRGTVPGDVLQSGKTDGNTLEALRSQLARGEGFRIEICNRRKDGKDYWVDVDMQQLLDPHGRVSGYMAIETDVTEQRAIRLRLEQLAREQAVMLDSELIGIARGRNRVSVWNNLGLARMFGYSPEELRGAPARLLYLDDASYTAVAEAAYPVLRAGGTYRTQLPMRHRSGATLWIDLSGVMISREPEESMWLMVDITAMKRQHVVMEQAAMHDALTGLPNRALLAERFAQALENARRQRQRLAVAYMDLDGFKAVNDTWGHDAGDAVLCAVAQRLPASLRSSDTVARLGGDEFVMVLAPVGTPGEAQEVVQRVQVAVKQPVALPGGGQAQVGASIGLAWFPDDGDDAEALLALADQRMFEEKRARRAMHGADRTADGAPSGLVPP